MEYSADGLTQTTNFTYGLSVSGTRTAEGRAFQRVVRMQLPFMLTPQYWKRHELSADSLTTILSYFSPRILWKCALLLGISCTSSSIKINRVRPCSMTFTSKNVVIKKICKVLCKDSKDSSPNKESNRSVLAGEHVPPLPVHLVQPCIASHLQHLHSSSSLSLSSDRFRKLSFNGFFLWKSVRFVPIEIEPHGVFCMRIVPVNKYTRQINGLIDRPFLLEIEGVEYYAVDDVCYFSAATV